MSRVAKAFLLVLVLMVGLVPMGVTPTARAHGDATPVGRGTDAKSHGVTSDFIAYGPGLPGTGALVLFRLAFAPGGVLPLDPHDPTNLLLVVESGAATVRVAAPVVVIRAAADEGGRPGDVEEIPTGDTVALGVGDSVVVPGSAAGEVRNVGSGVAVLLVAGADPSEVQGKGTEGAGDPGGGGTPTP